VRWILQQNDHQCEYISILIHEVPLIYFGLLYCLHNVTTIHHQFCGQEKYPRLNIWKLQEKPSYVDDFQDYQDIFEIANNKLCLSTKDVMLNPYFHVQQEKVQTKRPRHFQKKHMIKDVEPGVRLDLVP